MPDLPPLPEPFQRVVSPETGLVDPDWYRWFQALVDYASDTSDLDTGLAGKAGRAQVDAWCDFVPKVVNGDVVVQQKVAFAGTIGSSITDCDSGACSVRLKIDGADVGSTANAVSTTETEQTHTTANTFTAGQTISYTISANATCIGARVQINYSRTLAA